MYHKQHRNNQNSSKSAHTPPTNRFAPSKFFVQPKQEERKPISAEEYEKIKASEGNYHDSSIVTNRPIHKPPTIQLKLKIGQIGDKYEQEADQVAQEVVQHIHAPETPSVQTKEQQEDQQIRLKPLVNRIQHQESEEKIPVNTKEASSSVQSEIASEGLETSIQQSKGGGQPLADSIRQPMEKAFGKDFSGVKVHTDARSDQMNQSIQAKAFTTGQDIFFRGGEYNPASKAGQELIAHELTHVVQQTGLISRRPEPQSISQTISQQPGNRTIQRSKPLKQVSSLAMKRINQAKEAIKHTKEVFTYGAGNQKEALQATNFNTDFRVEVMRNPKYWNLTDAVQPIAQANPDALIAAQADIVAGGNCGEHASVAFDYLRVKAVGEKISVAAVNGLDHEFVLIGDLAESDDRIAVSDPWPTQATATLWEDHFAYTPDRSQTLIESSMVADGQNVKKVIAAGLTLTQEGKDLAQTKLSDKETKDRIDAEVGGWIWDHPNAAAEGKDYNYHDPNP